jgi:predicted alpha/beta-fold hydrolase
MRTCGGTEGLCRTLYHAGLTGDLLSVVRQMHAEGHSPPFLVGYSLGANVVLKLAGELGADAPALIRGVCAVSPPLDLASSARRMAEKQNLFYERRLVSRMKHRLLATGRYRLSDFAGLGSVMDMDDRITAPSFGFGNAEKYSHAIGVDLYWQHQRSGRAHLR